MISDDRTSLEMGFSSFPQRLDAAAVPAELAQCDDTTAVECARFAIGQIENPDDGFSTDLLPRSTLVRCALLGSSNTHYRNYLYNDIISLRELVERKINKYNSEKYIIAVNAKSIYYCFSARKFSYDQLDNINEITHSIQFMLLIPKFGGTFTFFEDAPACFMSFQSIEQFEQDFMSPDKAMSIFLENASEWQITDDHGERQWLKEVELAMNPNIQGNTSSLHR